MTSGRHYQCSGMVAVFLNVFIEIWSYIWDVQEHKKCLMFYVVSYTDAVGTSRHMRFLQMDTELWVFHEKYTGLMR